VATDLDGTLLRSDGTLAGTAANDEAGVAQVLERLLAAHA
jgi:hydroxymethylpyrimidine pyrophosphatase-like HAD family hydrolase